MNKLCEPGEILAKEVERGGILVKGRNGDGHQLRHRQRHSSHRRRHSIATAPDRASAGSRASTDCGSAYRKNNSDGRSSERKETDRESAKGKEAARQSSKARTSQIECHLARRCRGHVRASLAFPIRTDGNSPER